jgi:hypothetical protein
LIRSIVPRVPRCILAALVLASVSLASPAFAQSDADKATARELAKEGAEAIEKKEFAMALDRFTRANALFHAPTLVLGIARAQVGLGKLVAAQENYHLILREGVPANAPEAFVQAINDAKKELAALAPQVPWVIVMIDGPKDPRDVKVKLDSEDVPPAAIGVRRAIDPGEHTIRAEAKGFVTAEKKFTVAAGMTETIDVALAPVPLVRHPKDTARPEAPASEGLFPHQYAVGIVALGIGSAGLVVGTVTGLLALDKHSDLEGAGCNDVGCPSAQKEALDSYHTLGTLSTVGFIAGGVGAAVGVVLVATAPKSPKKAGPEATKSSGVRVSPFIGVGQVGLTGRF